ncbi:SMC family ATPase [Bacteroides fragilis]|uniref:SMC family ATPase n=1 Tax=Bacteroides fragilis TaxID=817 RepID=A0A396C4F6_BACFG|nr:SMC family ATPase [Bacteroides fragilis]RHH14327.1 SMC family ATPase [Bacteroides fragilis]
MWKLNRIIAENLCAFRQLDYYLQQGVTTLVFGNNLDNESQKSNGSGKSALIECIAVGLTGTPLRKIKNEEIINDKADGCYVMLQFTNDGSNEIFTIERQLFRKDSTVVTCHIERDGKLVESDEAVQPSIDGYNKFILEKLGISKEELYNNFLLSKFKFQDFLSSSDREKKEIINRFSNGILVDGAIDKLAEDKLPVAEELRKAELEIAGIDGRIEMLAEQIIAEENSRIEKKRSKEEKIASMQQTISEKRALTRQKEEELKAIDCLLGTLENADVEIQSLENEDHSLEYYLTRIRALLQPLAIELSDWEKTIEKKCLERKELEKELAGWDEQLAKAGEKVAAFTASYEQLKEEYRIFTRTYATRVGTYDEKLEQMEQEVAQANRDIGQLLQNRRTLSKAIEELHARLAGTITCPRCNHEFLVSDRTFDVDKGHRELEERKKRLSTLTNRITECESNVVALENTQKEIRANKRELTMLNSQWCDRIDQSSLHYRTASGELDGIAASQKKVKAAITSLWTDQGHICKRVFDEAFDLIDDARREKERKIKSVQEEKAALKSSIDTLEEAIRELDKVSSSDLTDSLKASLKAYRKKSSEAVTRKLGIGKRMQRLEEQEQHFVQFKTYLANTKIEALNSITNEFLENIGSDIRIKLSGYTALKTGKVREKISASLVRDGIDQGSFGKFSAGEAVRVNLATILAMQKLINSNCELDKGLDLLVLDEILEAVDEDGLSSIFAALNHLGITALVVSHGNVAESYPYKLIVTKEHGYSTID